jgi:hypothetical protein
MKGFETIALEIKALSKELDELQALLASTTALKERAQIAPFFKNRKQLCAGLGFTNSSIAMSDRVAIELELFGDFVCDAASGDSQTNAYTLIEFEDAQERSVFSRLESGKIMKKWSPRFEHGFSQLVDWAWRLSTEGTSSHAFQRIFGANDPTIHLLLVAGRDADLTKGDLARLRWRANQISLGAFRMSCLTFDGALGTIRRRLLLATQTPV